MFQRFLLSVQALCLRPRGELVLSLTAIGLAVALPASALLWTTLRGWDRDRREGIGQLQALHRLNLEEAVRILEAGLEARVGRAGHRSPVVPSDAGKVFRELLASTAGTDVPPAGPDGLLVLGFDGTPIYPAPATGVLAPPEVDVRGEALVGAFHRRLVTQPMEEAYLGLAAQLVEGRLEASRSPSGRLYLPGIRWAALRHLSRNDPRFGPTLEGLVGELTRYEAPLMPASQRLFLARELRRLGAHVRLPGESAEVLGLAVVQALGGAPSRERRDLVVVRPDSTGPGQEVWLLPAPGGGVVWLHRRERLQAELEEGINRRLEPVGYRARLVAPMPTAPMATAPMADAPEAPLGSVLPGWRLRLDASMAAERWNRETRRRAALQAASAGSAVVLGTVLGSLAIRRFLRRVRMAEVRHDFLTTVSHELRTPMTSIRMLIESLVADPDPGPERIRSYLTVVARETQRLGRLVDDYLTFARLERGAMNYDFQPTAPEAVVEAAVGSIAPRFDIPGCEFHTEVAAGLPRVRADAPSLTLALLNLLENAYKYTGADKRILLSVTRCGSTVCFAVTDNGRGFDPAHRGRIFEKFARLEGSVGTVTGAGIGLHLVQSIVEAHGGRVEVDTAPGEGSRFALQVPVVPDEAVRTVASSAAPTPPSPRPSTPSHEA